MKKIKQRFLRRPSGRELNANKDYDLNADSTGVRGSTYSGSTPLAGGQAEEESGPWGLKELYPGRDPVVE